MVVNDATINIGEYGLLMGSAGRNVSATNARSSYTFNNCTIVADKASRVIIKNSNEFTKIAFNCCYIYGSINPDRSEAFDGSGNNAFVGSIEGPKANSVTFDGSTWFSSGATLKESVVAPKVGYFAYATDPELEGYSNKEVTYTVNELRDDADYIGFKDSEQVTSTLTLDMTVNPKLFRVSYDTEVDYSADDFTEAVASAKALSTKYSGATVTITFLGDYTITNGEGDKWEKTEINEYDIAVINFPLILDLDGRTLSFVQGYLQESFKKTANGEYEYDKYGNKILNNSAQETIKINSTVTVKDGTIVARNKDSNKSYPIFTAGSSFNLTLENVTSYVGAIFYSYNSSGTFTINGGEHHVPYASHGGWGASWFETHSSLTFTANDASFHLGNASNIWLISAISNSTRGEMNYTFNNCDIISEGSSNSIIRFANDITSIAFNNCRIKGNLTPGQYTGNSYNPEPISKITFGEGTVYAGTATEGLICVPDGYVYRESARADKIPFYVTETPSVTKVTDKEDREIGTVVIDPNRLDKSYSFTYAVLKGVVIEVMDKDGVVMSGTTILPGEAVGTLPTLEPVTEETGYVKVTYTGNWVDKDGNVVTAESLAGNTDMDIYPEVAVTPYLKDAMLNLQLMGHIKPRLLLPFDTLPENIEIISVNHLSNGEKGSAISGSDATFNGVKYKAYGFNAVGATSIATEYQVIVTYTVDICGRTETVEQTISKLSALKYINNVLSQYVVSEDNPTAKDPDSTAALVANMLRYSYYVCRYNGNIKADGTASSQYSGIAEAYNTYNHLCTEFNEDYFKLPNQLATAEDDLSQYVQWIRFDIEGYQPKFKLKLYSGLNEDGSLGDNSVVAVKFEVVEGFKPAYGSSVINWGQNLSMQINKNHGTSYYNADGNGVYGGYIVTDNDGWTKTGTASDNTGAIHIVCPDNLEAYNIIRNIRITLTLNSGATVSGVYNLRAYYNSVVESTLIAEEDKPLIYETLYAIQAYSDIVAAYRFGPARDETGWVSYDRANGYGEKASS